MLYFGIDQHSRQITISLRNEEGDVVQARQVSTRPEKINEFFQRLTRDRLREGESFAAVLEVSGFGDWLITMLRDYRCHKSGGSGCPARIIIGQAGVVLECPACGWVGQTYPAPEPD